MKTLKQKLRDRELSLGSWLTFPCEASAEIMCRAGFEWLVIDMEHAPIGVHEASRLIRVIDLAGLPALCRLPSNNPDIAKAVLDAGAAGIIVPTIESGEQARKAVDAAYYPPRGKRGVGLGRAQAYGSGFEEYRRRAEESLVVIVMIETAAGVKNVESIAATPGIDGLLIGPYDLSASLGLPGAVDHAEVRAAIARVRTACLDAHVPIGIFGLTAEAVKPYVEQGFTMIVAGVDAVLLGNAAASLLKAVRET